MNKLNSKHTTNTSQQASERSANQTHPRGLASSSSLPSELWVTWSKKIKKKQGPSSSDMQIQEIPHSPCPRFHQLTFFAILSFAKSYDALIQAKRIRWGDKPSVSRTHLGDQGDKSTEQVRRGKSQVSQTARASRRFNCSCICRWRFQKGSIP